MSLRHQPVKVGTDSFDVEGQLVFADGFLTAVLVRLSEYHEDIAGMWFLDAGFGLVSSATPPMFSDVDEAQSWIERRLAHTA